MVQQVQSATQLTNTSSSHFCHCFAYLPPHSWVVLLLNSDEEALLTWLQHRGINLHQLLRGLPTQPAKQNGSDGPHLYKTERWLRERVFEKRENSNSA